MFYINGNCPNGKGFSIEITDENVFTCCPNCGRELSVDLAKLFSEGEGDLFSTHVVCCECEQKWMRQFQKCRQNPGRYDRGFIDESDFSPAIFDRLVSGEGRRRL